MPRERIAMECTLAHVGQWQERYTQWRGLCKKLLDLYRSAVALTFHLLARSGPCIRNTASGNVWKRCGAFLLPVCLLACFEPGSQIV